MIHNLILFATFVFMKHILLALLLFCSVQGHAQEEWQQIEGQVFELFPRFREFMENHVSLLNDKEYKTCILIRAGFKPKSISNMLNVGPSYISNIRTEMLKTLFGIVGSSKVFDEILKGMN